MENQNQNEMTAREKHLAKKEKERKSLIRRVKNAIAKGCDNPTEVSQYLEVRGVKHLKAVVNKIFNEEIKKKEEQNN